MLSTGICCVALRDKPEDLHETCKDWGKRNPTHDDCFHSFGPIFLVFSHSHLNHDWSSGEHTSGNPTVMAAVDVDDNQQLALTFSIEVKGPKCQKSNMFKMTGSFWIWILGIYTYPPLYDLMVAVSTNPTLQTDPVQRVPISRHA